VIVNVCPAAVTPASPDQVWSVLTTPERFGEWQDATFVSADPPGAAKSGQTIHLSARGFGRRWSVSIEVVDMDPHRRWIDLRVDLPLGVVNQEHVTLSETKEGGTLVRFN
jgi:ligand-binding SRPBCC domain-containing protein